MQLRIMTAALLALATSTAATAADWWFVGGVGGGTPKHSVHFVDNASIMERGTSRLAWDYQIKKTLDIKGVRKSKNLWSFDCSNRTVKLISWTNYGNNAKLLDSYTVPSYRQTEEYITPDSIGEFKWKFVCEGLREDTVQLNGKLPEEAAAIYFRF